MDTDKIAKCDHIYAYEACINDNCTLTIIKYCSICKIEEGLTIEESEFEKNQYILKKLFERLKINTMLKEKFKDMIENIEEVDPEISQLVDKNIWDLF